MKAKLIYDIPDEDRMFISACFGLELSTALSLFAEYLRRYDKHRKLTEEQQEILEDIRRQWEEEVSSLPNTLFF